MTTPALAFITLQIEAPPIARSFILGRNRVGDPLTAAGVTVTWHDVTGQATEISIGRGGNLDGVTVALDVGVLTARFANLTTPAALAPNRPVRLLLNADSEPLFTGRILDLAATFDKAGNEITTLIGVDSIREVSNTKVAGVTSPGGWEPWADRITRLCAYATVPTNPPGA